MPTVPITGPRQLLTGNAPSETDYLMALAEMKSLGRLGANETLSNPSPDPNARRSTNRRSTSPVR